MQTNHKDNSRKKNAGQNTNQTNHCGETVDPEIAALMKNWRKIANPAKYRRDQAMLRRWSRHLAKILAKY